MREVLGMKLESDGSDDEDPDYDEACADATPAEEAEWVAAVAEFERGACAWIARCTDRMRRSAKRRRCHELDGMQEGRMWGNLRSMLGGLEHVEKRLRGRPAGAL